MPTLQQYINAIQRQAGNASTVQLRENGKTLPVMSVNEAAEYLYGGTKPKTTVMPSENNKMYTDPDIVKINESEQAKVRDQQMRQVYTHGVLPYLTLGASEIFTNGDPRKMSLATAGAIGTRAGLRALPLGLGAAATALWSYYANNNAPTFSTSSSYPQSVYLTNANDSVPGDSLPQPAPSTQGNTTTTGSPAPQDNQDNKKPEDKKKGLKDKGVLPYTGYKGGSWLGNIARGYRDVLTTIGGGIAADQLVPVPFELAGRYITGSPVSHRGAIGWGRHWLSGDSVPQTTSQLRAATLPNGTTVYLQPGDSLPSEKGTNIQITQQPDSSAVIGYNLDDL